MVRTNEIKPEPNDLSKPTYGIVNRNANVAIGLVAWNSWWKRYCFYPEEDTVWDVGCLADVQDFINSLEDGYGRKKADCDHLPDN